MVNEPLGEAKAKRLIMKIGEIDELRQRILSGEKVKACCMGCCSIAMTIEMLPLLLFYWCVLMLSCSALFHFRVNQSSKVHFKTWIFTGTLAIRRSSIKKAGSIHQTGFRCAEASRQRLYG